MHLQLPLHLAIHFLLAILSGYLAGKHFKNLKLGILVGFCGGFLIDLDHVLEYFLVFGPHFNFLYFTQGREFLASNSLHLWFHAWEYIPILVIIGLLFKKKTTLKTIFITLAFAASIHLITDMIVNQYSFNFYTLTYRAEHNFSAKELMNPESYQENQELKLELGM